MLFYTFLASVLITPMVMFSESKVNQDNTMR